MNKEELPSLKEIAEDRKFFGELINENLKQLQDEYGHREQQLNNKTRKMVSDLLVQMKTIAKAAKIDRNAQVLIMEIMLADIMLSIDEVLEEECIAARSAVAEE